MIPSKKDKNQQIQVFIRVRPLNKQEGNTNVIDFKSAKELSIKHHSTLRTYTFDRVFGPNSKQIEVYKLVAEPTVAEVISGYNCTVLAYGQTGTGKTYTMAGEMANPTSEATWLEDKHSGIIPRTLAHMFDELRVQQLEYTVRVSYLELYNEEIFDLLSPVEDNSKLKLFDDSMKKGSVIVQGLTETTVNNKAEVFKILEKGAEKRRIASTLMNSQSSRSHTVFCITVHTKENAIDGEDLLKTGKLYLVDLAGSENIKQSGATDLRAREAFNINQSLLTLGRCIVKLTERSTHIPYRESKLTRLLQDSLGGRTKTTLIATVSPAFCSADETMNTLEYAMRAKSITNKPEINQRLSKKTLLKEYTEEIERLRKDLIATKIGRGIYLDEDNYASLTSERETHKVEIAEKISMLRVLQDEMERKEALCEQLKISLEEHQKVVETKVKTICTLESKLETASSTISDLSEQNELKEFIVEKYSETEEALKTTAKELLTVADTTTADSRKLHDKLDVLTDMNKHNKMLCEQHISEFNLKIDGINNKLRMFHGKEYKFHQSMFDIFQLLAKTNASFKNNTDETLNLIQCFADDVSHLKSDIGADLSQFGEGLQEAQSIVSQEVEKGKTKFENKYNCFVTPQVKLLADHIKKQDEIQENFISGCKQMLDDNYCHIYEFVHTCKEMVLDAKEEAYKHIEKEIQMCQQAQKQIAESTKLEKETQLTIEKNFDIITKAMRDIQSATGEYIATNQKKTEQCSKNFIGLNDYLLETKDEFNKTTQLTNNCIDDFNNLMISNTEDNKDIILNSESQRAEIHDKLETTQRDVDKVLEDYNSFSLTICDEFSESCNSHLDKQLEITNKKSEEHATRLTLLKNNFTQLKSSVDSQNKSIFKSIETNSDRISNETKDHEVYCSEMESVVSADLDNCREGFRKLYTSSLKEYKQTGQTPQRKFYRYPRNVIETKPREKLIEEYNKIRSSSASRSDDGKENSTQDEVSGNIRSYSESNIPRALAEFDGNRSLDINKSVAKDFRPPFTGEQNVIIEDNQ